MNSKKDYYDILGVSKDASENEIKKAYHKLVKKYHPDKSQDVDTTEKFKQVQEAYKILSDVEKRNNYDRFGHQENYNNFNGSGFEFNQEFHFDDIFENFFGSRNKNKKNKKNVEDKHINITIDFLEACLGVEKEIEFKYEKDCEKCSGTGAYSQRDIKNCNYCNGSGYIQKNQTTFLGIIANQQICPYCRGLGQTILKKCLFCKGLKRVSNVKKIKINIPAGIENNMTMKIENEGNSGHLNYNNSDLYVNIKVKNHEIFQRENQDIITTLFIDFYDAILGNDFIISTIYGKVDLKIPEGTQSHTKFRIKNKGIAHLNSSYRKGDHYVIVKIKTPTNLSSHQKKLIQQFKELDKFNENIKKNKSWFF